VILNYLVVWVWQPDFKWGIMVLVLMNCNIWLAGICRFTFLQYNAWSLKINTGFINHTDEQVLRTRAVLYIAVLLPYKQLFS
jgi:hypothetical protein